MKPIAIVTCLPPERSGVAIFSSRAFECVPTAIHYYSSGTHEELLDKQGRIAASAHERIVYPVSRLGALHDPRIYQAIVFVLGNSSHNVPALRAAIRLRPTSIRRLLYLHDVRVTGLLSMHLAGDLGALRRNLKYHYFEAAEWLARAATHELLGGGILGLRWFFELVGPATVLVNSDRARRLILGEVGAYTAPPIETLFHPIFSISKPACRRVPRDWALTVGHFGILNPMKQPELLIRASELISRRRGVRLLFAGYSVSPYFRDQILPDFVTLRENLDEKDLLAEMRDADVVVQLRYPDHGESSGIVRQLVALGKIPIVTCGTAEEELGPLVRLIRPEISAEDLADVILAHHLRNDAPPPPREDLSTLSYAEKLVSILSSTPFSPIPI